MGSNRQHRPNCQCPQCRDAHRRPQSRSVSIPWSRAWAKLKYYVLVVTAAGSLLTILLALFGGAVFFQGYTMGYESAEDEAAMYGSLRPYLDTQTGYGDDTYVPENVTGTFHIDGYTIRLRGPDYPGLENSTVGYTTRNDDIYIENGRQVSDLYDTCVHEKLHNVAPDAPHDWVYGWEEHVDGTCLAFVYQLGQQP